MIHYSIRDKDSVNAEREIGLLVCMLKGKPRTFYWLLC